MRFEDRFPLVPPVDAFVTDEAHLELSTLEGPALTRGRSEDVYTNVQLPVIGALSLYEELIAFIKNQGEKDSGDAVVLGPDVYSWMNKILLHYHDVGRGYGIRTKLVGSDAGQEAGVCFQFTLRGSDRWSEEPITTEPATARELIFSLLYEASLEGVWPLLERIDEVCELEELSGGSRTASGADKLEVLLHMMSTGRPNLDLSKEMEVDREELVARAPSSLFRTALEEGVQHSRSHVEQVLEEVDGALKRTRPYLRDLIEPLLTDGSPEARTWAQRMSRYVEGGSREARSS